MTRVIAIRVARDKRPLRPGGGAWIFRSLLLFLVWSAVLPAVALQAPGQTWAQTTGGLATFERETLAIETASKGRRDFNIELALSPEQKAQGLMFRRDMAEDAGMLFVYRRARVINMWMKNTLIPLDMLFIDSTGLIVKIVERTVPMSLTSISSDAPALAVLELNGGSAARFGIAPGDRVLHPAFDGGAS